MGSVRRGRGRLPRRVYWVRRSLVLVLGLALVFAIGKLIGGTGSDAGSALEARTSSAQQQDSGPSPTLGPVVPSEKLRAVAKAPLLPPSGDCREDEVSVQPSVPRAWGGQPIVVRLRLQGLQPACTFTISAETLVVKIADGKHRIWSSQECPKSVRDAEVVVRSGLPTYFNVIWSGRRSEPGCPGRTAWVLPGFYHVYAAALGSAATDVPFEIVRPPTQVVTKTPKPKPSQQATATSKPRATPSSTVSGKQSRCGGDNAAGSC